MRKLIERSIASVEKRLVLVAPQHAAIPPHFRNVTYSVDERRHVVREMQRLRGSVYLEEGNLTAKQLSPDGLHQTPEDARSWHLLMMDTDRRHASSCAWYLEHDAAVSMHDLRVRNCPLASRMDWQGPLQWAVESEIERARRENLRYAEVGGWAVSRHRRCTSEGLMLALAAYGLCRILGGALGITTANVKHSSSSILRRLGGSYLEFQGTSIPAYFDPHYNANIEILRFDSRRPSLKYSSFIELLAQRLSNVSVFATPQPVLGFQRPYAMAVTGHA